MQLQVLEELRGEKAAMRKRILLLFCVAAVICAGIVLFQRCKLSAGGRGTVKKLWYCYEARRILRQPVCVEAVWTFG